MNDHDTNPEQNPTAGKAFNPKIGGPEVARSEKLAVSAQLCYCGITDGSKTAHPYTPGHCKTAREPRPHRYAADKRGSGFRSNYGE